VCVCEREREREREIERRPKVQNIPFDSSVFSVPVLLQKTDKHF